jgi:hypothetical protein
MTVKRQLRAALDPLAKARYLAQQSRRSGRPLVVLTPGKAGSTAIGDTLEAHLPDRPVYKVHWLSPEQLAASEAGYRVRHEHILASHHLRRHLPTPEEPWEVVIPVREPVARNVAALFQTGDRFGHTLDDPAAAVHELLAWRQWGAILSWFDTEVRDTIGVDVLAHPFDRARGWQVIEAPTARVLVIRQEDLDRAPEALSAFLDVEIPALVRANVGSDKGYAEAYERFRREASFPAEALDEVYGSRYARHLYTDDEIAGFRARWG